MEQEYESQTKTPIYLFSVPILIAGLIVLLVIGNVASQKEKKAFVANPEVGDVYRIRREENNSTTYYFLRISNISGDTVSVYHNDLEYHGFVTKFNGEDFFVKNEELLYTKDELKQMLENDEINSVERGYGNGEGFNRLR
jgi:hypothetical protein